MKTHVYIMSLTVVNSESGTDIAIWCTCRCKPVIDMFFFYGDWRAFQDRSLLPPMIQRVKLLKQLPQASQCLEIVLRRPPARERRRIEVRFHQLKNQLELGRSGVGTNTFVMTTPSVKLWPLYGWAVTWGSMARVLQPQFATQTGYFYLIFIIEYDSVLKH